MKDGATADEDRRRSAEAVLRIREESRRRVARQRHRSCFSWCMVASLIGGISLAAMDAYDARLQRDEPAVAANQGLAEREAAYDAWLRQHVQRLAAKEETRRARVAGACARRDVVLAKIERDAPEWLKDTRTEEERRLRILPEPDSSATAVIEAAAAAGCDQPISY